MKISEILQLESGATCKRLGVDTTIESVAIVPVFHEGFDRHGDVETIDLSYLEMLYTTALGAGALYSGPPVRMNLDLKEFE